MRPITVSLGNITTAASATAVRTATTVAAGDLVLNGAAVTAGTAIFEADRSVLVTFAGVEPGLRLALSGQNSAGQGVGETIVAPVAAGAVLSTNNYRKLFQVSSNQASVAAISIGTTAAGASPWVAFDSWAPAPISIQTSVTGTVGYTLQSTLDNPNDVTSPIYNNPGLAVWINSSDTTMVGASTGLQSNFLFAPQFARLLHVSGTGLVTATFLQSGAS